MSSNNETVITKDDAKKQMKVVRHFDAPLEQVWKAWTDSNLLDKWWAPKPWKAQTKSMDFRPGGFWLYAMVGPEGEKHWARMDYESVSAPKNYVGQDSFCDEEGIKNEDMPGMYWNAQFTSSGEGTKVEVTITFTTEEQMQKIIEMGFKEGFTMAHGNLDELLEEQKVAR
jgi:uncharacterized protein YndB with AHSA1/START domain